MEDHVGMGYAVCPLCGKEHDEVVLLATKYKRVEGELQPREPVPRRVCTGMKVCDECHIPDYIVVLEVDERYAHPGPDGRVSSGDGIPLTGRAAQIHEALLNEDYRALLNEDDRILLCGKDTMDILKERSDASARR